MKKFIAIFLAVIMCMSLCACGGGDSTNETTEPQLSKEELIRNAITTDIATLQTAVYNNKVKAKQDYCNKPIIVTGNAEVKDDHVVICDSQVSLDAYLPVEDLAKITSHTNITVVGIINDIKDMETVWGGQTFTFPHYIMEFGYLIEE